LRGIVEELDSDDAADLLESISKDRAQAVLEGLPGSVGARIQQLLKYPPDTAGGLMKSEYAAVLEGATVEEAVEIVRTLAEAVADIHNVLVVDHRFHLLGVLSLAQLILARTGQTVDAVMDRQVISVTVDTDQEEVARLFRKYDLVSLPVTDRRGAGAAPPPPGSGLSKTPDNRLVRTLRCLTVPAGSARRSPGSR
jgi:magnesium transporter